MVRIRSVNMSKWSVVILSLLLFATTALAQSGSKTWNFDSEKAGEVPSGFNPVVGEWKTVPDSTAISHHALAQVARNSGSTFNLILVSDTSYKDVDVSVAMKAAAGKEDQGGGLVWRAKDAENYYVARFNPLEDNYNLYKVEDGRRSQIEGTKIQARPGWHALRVTMNGNHIECYFDGKKVMDAKDSTFTDPGKIGLWTKSDAQTHFDKLTVNVG